MHGFHEQVIFEHSKSLQLVGKLTAKTGPHIAIQDCTYSGKYTCTVQYA